VWFTTDDDASVAALRAAGGEALLTLGPSFAGRPLWAGLRDLWRAAVPFRRLVACDARGAAVQFRLAGPVLRWWCRRRGLAILVWTINDDRRLRHFLRARGVTAVVTDRPHQALSLR
jgi:glycerophosphoryl diester phosphodiesterase